MDDSGSLRIHLLGHFRVLFGDQAVPGSAWRRRRPTSLLQLLALSPGYRLHREQIIDTLWRDMDPAAGANNLNVTVHELRRVLERNPTAVRQHIERAGETIALVPPEQIWVDVVAFETTMSEAWRTGEPALFLRAIDLYTGELLTDSPYDEGIDARRTSLRASYLTALARLAQIHHLNGDDDAAIAALARILETEPLDEEVTRKLMLSFARSGQRSRALNQYQILASTLERELGTEPEESTSDLYRAILDETSTLTVTLQGESTNQSPAGHVTSPNTRRSNLPAEVVSLFGREREIAELTHHLSTTRLVTLTGPGGVGKTVLALAAAREVEDRFTRVYYVPLESVREPEFVLSALAQSMKLEDGSGQSTADRLVEHVADHESLLVLDNFEQVIGAAPDLAQLLSRCRALRMLVTSRTRLRLQGEHEFPVAPLSTPGQDESVATVHRFPATQLFITRARQIRPSFQPTRQSIPTIAEICRQLDGLPLAIELAAARCKLLSPEALLPRLEQRLAILTGGSRDLPARQQTIRDTIAWSYELLDAEAQQMLRALSVFIGGWDLDAAAAIHECLPAERDSVDTLDLLFSLADHSLLIVDEHSLPQPRFRMLETIREFGVEQLATWSEEAVVRERHARYFADLVSTAMTFMYGPEQVAWIDRLEQEHPNIRAALDWFLANDVKSGLRMVGPLWHLWWMRSYLPIGRYYYDAFLAEIDESSVDQTSFAHALTGAGIITEWQGDPDRARLLQKRALSIWLGCADPPDGSYWSYLSLGNIAYNLGNLGTAESWFEQGLEFSKRHGFDYGEYVMKDSLAMVALLQGRYDRAETLLRQNSATALDHGDTWSISESTRYLGIMLLSQGRYEDARPLLVHALEAARHLGSVVYTIQSLQGLSILELQLNRLEEAQSFIEESLANAIEASDSLGTAWAKQIMGAIARKRRDHEQAERLYRESFEESLVALERDAVPGAIEGLAALFSDRAKYESAIRLFGAAAAFRNHLGMTTTVPAQSVIEAPLAKARSALPPDVAERAWSEGAALTVEQIYAELGQQFTT